MRLPHLAAFILTAVLAFADPVAIVPADFGNALQPQVAIAADGTVHVALGRGTEIFVATSRNGGRSFEAPVKVGELPKLALGMRRGPRIAVAGREVTITAISHDTGDLFGFHSSNGGQAWSAPTRINDVARAAGEGLDGLAQGPQGRLFVTWLDHRTGKMEIYGAESLDAGRTWGPNLLVYHSPEDKVCECCHPSAAYNSAGDLVVMFRNWLQGNRDLWITTRRAGQKAFAAASRQGEASWKLPGCPMDGGAIFSLADDSFASVWRRDKEVFLSTKAKPESRLGEGTQPIAFSGRDGVQVWWQQGVNLMRTSTAPGATATLFATNAKFAAAAVSPRDDSVVVAFEGTAEPRKGLFAEIFR